MDPKYSHPTKMLVKLSHQVAASNRTSLQKRKWVLKAEVDKIAKMNMKTIIYSGTLNSTEFSEIKM